MSKVKPDIEVEYKFWVAHKKQLVQKLNKKSSKKKPREYQKNVMFDNPQDLMQTTDGRIRVTTAGSAKRKMLTYKKPLPSLNGAKQEIEYEIDFIDTGDQIEKILAQMEFKPNTSYERYRTEWQIGSVQITLDEYPFGDFVEIEGAAEKIEIIAKELLFNISEALVKPIDTIFRDWRKEQGLPFKAHMNFDDFDK